MSKKGKYVVGKVRNKGGREWTIVEVAILFSEDINHSDTERLFLEVISAGFFFVHIESNGERTVIISGRSESLNKNSRPEDKQLVKRALGFF